MSTFDHDVELAGATPGVAQRREDDLGPAVQRAVAGGRVGALRPEQLSALQRSVGNAGLATVLQREDDGEVKDDDTTSPVTSVVESGGGQPLDRATQSFMESRMGQDLSSVRVHNDSKASASAESVQAKAYTVGENVVFRSGEFNPTSDQGRRTLAHELTHVVQQREGPVDGEPAAGGIKVSTPGDRFERQADEVADEVMRLPADDAPPVQREGMPGEDEQEEELQTQRQEMPGEDEQEEELQTQRQEMPGEDEQEEELQTQRQEMPGEDEQEEELQTQRQEMPGEDEQEEELPAG